MKGRERGQPPTPRSPAARVSHTGYDAKERRLPVVHWERTLDTHELRHLIAVARGIIMIAVASAAPGFAPDISGCGGHLANLFGHSFVHGTMPMRTKSMSFLRRGFPALILLCSMLAQAHAVQVLTFEGLQDLEGILGFYNGGAGSLGSGPGPNLGVSFTAGALAVIDADAGGSGNFANEPSPDTVGFFLNAPSMSMNVPTGFSTGFSFYYSTAQPGSVAVYDGLNATGNLLAVLALNPLTMSGSGDPTGFFNTWAPVSMTFGGLAKSVDFSGAASLVAFDNITLGSACPASFLPGDFDFDCDVDGIDFLKWQRGESPDPLSSDDLADWETNYGTDLGPLASATSTVPEPATVVLVILTAAGVCLRKCRTTLRIPITHSRLRQAS